MGFTPRIYNVIMTIATCFFAINSKEIETATCLLFYPLGWVVIGIIVNYCNNNNT